MHHRTSSQLWHRPIRFASRCAISALYLLARKITTCSIAHRLASRIGRCAIAGFVSLGQKNHNMHHRTSTDSIRQSMCDICFVSLGQKITTCIIAHRPVRFQSMCDVCFCIYCQKITTCIIAHRPIRLASRCAMSAFVSPAKKSQHASSHIDRFDSSRCHSSDQKIARFRTHDLRNNFSICEY